MKAITTVPMARVMQIAVAPEVGAEAVVMVGSAAVPAADQGTVVVPHQVIMMAATTDQHRKVHLLEIIWSWDDAYVSFHLAPLLFFSLAMCGLYSFRLLVPSLGNNEAMIGL